MPQPRKGESQKKWMARCMGDPEQRKSFPEQKQRAAVCHSLYRRRKSKAANNMKQTITFNVQAGGRVEFLQGRRYLVHRAVMMTAGVRAGSNGPGLYTNEFLAQRPASWDHKPLVVYHPEKTASDPVVLNSRAIGFPLGTKHVAETGWETECWFDEERTKSVDERVYNALVDNKPLEISTGLVLQVDNTPGEFNGVKYDWKAIDYTPDHLAVLPDTTGACSAKDGCGIVTNCECTTVTNETSFSDISCALSDLLRDAHGKPGQYWYGFIDNVYDGYVVFYNDGKLWAQEYEAGTTLALVGDPQEVRRVTDYQALDGSYVGNAAGGRFDQPPTEETTVANDKKKERVDVLIKNGTAPEGDREWLMSLTDERLAILEKKPTTNETPKVEPTPEPTTKVVNNEAKPPTPEEWFKTAPPQVQQLVRNGLKAFNDEKVRLVKEILANPANTYTENALNAKGDNDIDDLRSLAALSRAATPAQTNPFQVNAPNYSGAGGGPPTTNQVKGDDSPLLLPNMFAAAK